MKRQHSAWTITNTGENIDLSRALVHAEHLAVRSVILISRPYQQRRACAMCRLRWPEIDLVCASQPLPIDEYIAAIGDVDRVINMLVGDTQRLCVYPRHGWAIELDVPETVHAAYDRLVDAGYTSRVIT